jgi:hypothetical protein
MQMFLSPRFAMLLLIGLPLAGGAVVHPHGASAFIMGAWAGTLIVAPPLMIFLWRLGCGQSDSFCVHLHGCQFSSE